MLVSAPQLSGPSWEFSNSWEVTPGLRAGITWNFLVDRAGTELSSDCRLQHLHRVSPRGLSQRGSWECRQEAHHENKVEAGGPF